MMPNLARMCQASAIFFLFLLQVILAVPSPESSSPTPDNAIQQQLQPIAQPAYTTVKQLQSNLSSSPEDSVLLCADGKGPLLEGEERIFPCAGQCPAGFECENLHGSNEGGICCPNLSELYRLYNEEEESEEEVEGKQAEQKADLGAEEMGVNAMALLEQHYGDAIARPRPKPRSAPSVEPELTAAALIRSKPVEIRRSQPKWQQEVAEANIWRPKAHAIRPAIGLKKGGIGNVDASGEEFSCRRQRLELYCEDGRRRTQFVMRWYAKEGQCYSYPWGYCPGEPVASDRTLRTRAECELLCTDPLDSGNDSPVVNVVRFGIGDGEPPKVLQQEQPKNLANVEKTREEEREGPLAAAALTQELVPGPDLGSVDQSEPEPIDLSAPLSAGESSPATAEHTHQPHQQQLPPPSSSSAELAEFLLADQRQQPKRKRCEKVSPYRAMCPQDGMPSQFTLRWYQRGQACFAYPYGYCHGESVYAEEPIKTERECLALCVQQRGSTRGLVGHQGLRRRHLMRH